MKKQNNDTWLGFFKKTLKISTYLLLGFISIIFVVIYFTEFKPDQVTYLSCKDMDTNETNYRAFNQKKLYQDWDSLNQKFERSYPIIKINKKIIKARGYAYSFSDGGSLKVSSLKMPEAKYVFEIIWELDRETGLTKTYFTNKKGKILDNMECQKIKKKNLPIKKIDQKF